MKPKWFLIHNRIRMEFRIFKNQKPTVLNAHEDSRLLEAYVSQLNELQPEFLIVMHEGYYRIYFPQLGPVGFLPANINFPGYKSPFTGVAYAGVENRFHIIENAILFLECYPNIVSKLINQLKSNFTPLPSITPILEKEKKG